MKKKHVLRSLLFIAFFSGAYFYSVMGVCACEQEPQYKVWARQHLWVKETLDFLNIETAYSYELEMQEPNVEIIRHEN